MESDVKKQDIDKLVNHPSHYAGQGAIECKELMKVVTCCYEGYVAACVANIVKYCWRCHGKETVRSLKSARWYLDEAVEMIKSLPRRELVRLRFISISLYSGDRSGETEQARFLTDVYLQMGKHFDKTEFGYFRAVVDNLFDGGLYRDASLPCSFGSGCADSFRAVREALDNWISYCGG